MANSNAFFVSILINLVLHLALLTAFSFLRRLVPHLYWGRCRKKHNPPPLPSPGLFSWWLESLSIDDSEFYDKSGLDALMYTLMFRTGVKVFGFCAFFAVVILMPIHSTASVVVCEDLVDFDDPVTNTSLTDLHGVRLEECSGVGGIDSLSLSSVPEESSRLWVHWVFTHFFALYAMYQFRGMYKVYMFYRRKYLSRGLTHQHTLMIRDLAEDLQDSAELKARFSALYPDVVAAHVVQRDKPLATAVAKRNKTLKALEHVLGEQRTKQLARQGLSPSHDDTNVSVQDPTSPVPEPEEDGVVPDDLPEAADDAIVSVPDVDLEELPEDERSTIKVGGFLCCGKRKVDAETHLREQLETDNVAVEAEFEKLDKAPQYFTTGFISFRSLASTVTATQVVNILQTFGMLQLDTPEPRDVHWENLKLPAWNVSVRQIVVFALVGLLLVFYTVPVAFVASLTTLEALSESLPFLESVADSSPAVKGFLEGFLPTLALLLFMSLIPTVLHIIASLRGFPSHSAIEFESLKLHFIFVVQVFFVSLIAGAAFDAVSDIIDDPSSIVTLLGESIPRTGVFFINYIILLAMVGHVVRLINPGPLFIGLLKLLLAKTDEERALAKKSPAFPYFFFAPIVIFAVLVGLTYSTIAPLMLPFACWFCTVGYVVYRYNFYWVFEPSFETGGKMWPIIFDRLMAGVFIYEATVAGALAVKKAKYEAPLLIPLLVFTWQFWGHTNTLFKERVDHLPREDVVELAKTRADRDRKDLLTAFKQPSLLAERRREPRPPEKLVAAAAV
eukprot:m.290607 g.290607  ORF g.290607 m.290607 type:complete len:786 (-) comp19469_c2_seq2:178-2535(-)